MVSSRGLSHFHPQEAQLKQIRIFSVLDPHLRKVLTGKEVDRVYARRQNLYYEGNPALGIYIIKSGQVKVSKIGPEGKQHILGIAHEGDSLGLSEVINGAFYQSTAAMVEEGIIGFIDAQTLRDILQKDPPTSLKVMEYLSQALQSSEQERVSLAQHAVRERMARLLVVLAQQHGIKNKEGVQINIDLSREELAEMIGTASETAIRLLKEFKDEKRLELKGKKIIILDMESFQEELGE